MRPPATARLLATVVALAVAGGAAGCGTFGGGEARSVTAFFDRTVGLYTSSDVRVLGVRIGQVTEIEPVGEKVRVEMEYDPKYEIPADAKAVIVAPSIVSDRYVQLTPVYQGGPVLDDGAVLENDRTAVPVELDQIYEALDELNVALGPKGANKDGALSDLIDVGAQNLEGNGELINSTLRDFSTLVGTISEQREDLFGTVSNLADFTTTIATSDDTVRAFNRDLAQVADQLEAEREDLARAVKELSLALGEVASFVRENREDLTANVQNLEDVTAVLVKQRTSLEEFLDVSPTALSNLQLAYNAETGTLDTRDNTFGLAADNPLQIVCTLLQTAGQTVAETCEDVADTVGTLPIPPPPGGAAPAPVARDMTLGGILDGGR